MQVYWLLIQLSTECGGAARASARVMLSRVSVPQIICADTDGPAAELPAEDDCGIGEADVPGIDIPGAIVFPAPEDVAAHPTSKAVEATTIASSQLPLLIRIIVVLRRMAGNQAGVDNNVVWVRTSGFVELATTGDQS